MSFAQRSIGRLPDMPHRPPDTTSGAPVVYVLITAIGSILTVMFTAPLQAGIDALLYTDLRMRKEGLDLALQQQLAVRPPVGGPPR